MRKAVLKPTSGEMDVKLIATIHGWQLQRDLPAQGAAPRQLLWVAPDMRSCKTGIW
jgi:hypothetical protein